MSSASASDAPNGEVGSRGTSSAGTVAQPRRRPYTSMPDRTTMERSDGHSAAAPRIETVPARVRSAALRGPVPRVRLVDAEMHHDIGIERADERHAAGAVTRVDAMELGAPQPAARGIDVEPCDLGDLAVRLEQLGDAGAELAAHARDQQSHPLNPVRASGSGTR